MISIADHSKHYRQVQPESWLQIPSEAVTTQYQDMLRDYLTRVSMDRSTVDESNKPAENNYEELLHQAYELGHRAMTEGIGLLDVVDIHETALAIVLEEGLQNPNKLIPRIRAGSRLLEEALSPYEISRLGCRDAIAGLRKLYDVLDGEAKRVAHLLHDETAQILAVVYMELAEFSRDAPEAVAERISLIVSLLDDVREQLRTLSHELRPVILDQLGLIPALRFLALGIRKRSDLEVIIHGETFERLPQGIETVLYRTVQEALGNVSRHARASQADVRLWIHNQAVYCVVSDNGIGFDVPVNGTRSNTGLGLLGINERVDSLGGNCSVISKPGEGAKLQVTIPL